MDQVKTLQELNELWLSSDDVHFDINFFKPLIPYINAILLEQNRFGGSLLDFGCGHGTKAKVFHEMGYKVCGIDKDINLLKRAEAGCHEIEYKQIFVDSTLPFENESFDVVFSCSVFQYLADHQLILNEFYRVLKPGGCVIMIENLKNNPISRGGRAYLKLRKFSYQSYPFNHFTYKEFSALSSQFHHSRTAFFHLLSPLTQHRLAKKYFTLFAKMDKFLLQIPGLKWISWIGFFGGIIKK